ncbi:iron-sulfur cluster repair di-iron protein [Mesobacillus foraminis]|jgi:regulator of cell morphogenesis and NO signaling|uniref:iron-sulfur cluster repair di-iron protein n=1 Tax=Mesobacillus foraminis TaxID=279826 RepID=UPI0039A0E5FC
MKLPFNEQTLVRDIVNIFPKSSDLFKKNRIDFCCGGSIPLADAAAEKAVSLESLMAELEDLYSRNVNSAEDMEFWTETPSAALVDHIQVQYHRTLEEELALLSPYVTKVARVHGENHPELVRMHDLFYELKKELLEHTAKEEAEVFPALLSLDDPAAENRETILMGIQELEKEHDHAGSILKELRDVTSDFTPPMDACGTYRLVYKRLEMLEAHTFMHVHLENNILFPRYFADITV